MRPRRPRRRSPRQTSAGPEAWGPSARGMRQVAHVCDAFGAQNDAEATPMRHGFGPKRRSLRHAGEKTCCRKGLDVARRARKWRMVCTCQAEPRRLGMIFASSAPPLLAYFPMQCYNRSCRTRTPPAGEPRHDQPTRRAPYQRGARALPAARPRHDQTNLRNSPRTMTCLQRPGPIGGAIGGHRCRRASFLWSATPAAPSAASDTCPPAERTNDLNHWRLWLHLAQKALAQRRSVPWVSL